MSFTSKKRTFPHRDVTLCLDAALAAERDALMARISSADRKSPADAKALSDIEERMRESIVTIRVCGVPYATYLKIQNAHPRREGRMEAFNPETFYSDFIYKTGFEVDGGEPKKLSEIPRREWDEFVENLTTAEIEALARVVEETNGQRVETAFLSLGSGSTEPSSQNSGQPESGA